MSEGPGTVILLRGLPGIGKTTVSAILRDRLAPAVRVSVDTIRYLARPRDLTDETIHLGEAAAAAVAETYAAEGFTAIVDGVFAEAAALDGFVGRLRSTGTPVAVVTLTGPLDAAVARNAARDIEMQLPDARIVQLHEQFDHSIGIVVDTGEYVAEEVAEIIEERLAAMPPEPARSTEPRTTVLFLRHGEAMVDPDCYADHRTMPLSPFGREQILGTRAAVRRLAPELVIASPLARARESAELLAAALGLELEIDERLRERTFPELYGRTYEQIADRIGTSAAERLRTNSDDVALDGGESLDDADARVQAAIAEISARPERRVLLVSHGGPHGWLCAAAIGAPGPRFGRRVRLDTARMSAFSLDASGALALDAMNCAPWGLVREI